MSSTVADIAGREHVVWRKWHTETPSDHSWISGEARTYGTPVLALISNVCQRPLGVPRGRNQSVWKGIAQTRTHCEAIVVHAANRCGLAVTGLAIVPVNCAGG